MIEAASKEMSCPPQQITAVARPDVDAMDFAAYTLGRPPPDIAASPERLSIWQWTRTESFAPSYRGRDVYEVRGCGIHNLFACRMAQNQGAILVDCSSLDRDLAIQRRHLVD